MGHKMTGREWTHILVGATLVAMMAACTHHNNIGTQVDASAGDASAGVAILGAACIDPSDGGLADGGIVETTDGFQTAGSAPLVAMDEQGNGIVAWHVQSGMTVQTIARRYTAGVGWSDIELVMQDGYATSVALWNGTALIALTGSRRADAGLESAVVYAASTTAGGWSVLPVGVTTTGWWQEPYTPPPVAVLG